MSKKIAIFGTTPSRMMGPHQDDSGWERWTIGPGGKDAHNWERLYEVHTVWPLNFGERPDLKKDTSYLDDLSREKRPIYTVVPMKQAMENWAAEHGKDLDWLKKHVRGNWSANVLIDKETLFEKYCRMLFQSSIDYCLCQAIEEKPTDIGCWGIDLESGEEYINQWFSAKVWLMLARLQGINIHLPPGSGLERDITPYPTRYETHLALTFQKKHEQLQGMLGQQEPQYEAMRAEAHKIEGSLLILRRLLSDKEFTKQFNENPEELLRTGEQELIQKNQLLGQAAATINTLKGELSATDFYRRMYCYGKHEPNWLSHTLF